MDTIALMRRILELEDWQLLIDHLADDVVFKVTIGEGTPISPELRGKQAVAGHLLNLGDLLEFRQEVPLSTSRVATASSCWAPCPPSMPWGASACLAISPMSTVWTDGQLTRGRRCLTSDRS